MLDLERNILHAKMIRPALCINFLNMRLEKNAASNSSSDGATSSELLVYDVRVEDVETGVSWVSLWVLLCLIASPV
jgi:hypothetical protein